MTEERSRVKFSNQSSLARIVNRPPFYFQGVTMRVFPVRANLATLRQFCQAYINFAPAEIARYEPFVPFVYVCLINYGRMEAIQNVGWVAQNEIAFTIPLEWYRKVDGSWKFQDFVSFSPFIYVDVEMSEITGREVYGWPKEYAFLSKRLNTWARNPRSDANLLSVERRVAAPDASEGWRRGEFLEVLQRPSPSFSFVPPEWDNPFNPSSVAARAGRGAWFTARTLGELAASSPLRGFSPTRPGSLVAMLEKIAGSSAVMAAGPFAPGGALERSLSSNTMNLKQFHVARRPRMACYQALVHAEMKLERFNRGGLLGDSTILLGDPTGGFELQLFRDTAGNLIDTLGLEAESDGGRRSERVTVLPFLPYWVDLDLTYGTGKPIGWRVLGERPSADEDRLRWRSPGSKKLFDPIPGDRGQYRDARAVPWDATIGPYMAPSVSSRVMTLRTEDDGDALRRFCDLYLNKPLEQTTGRRFEPWGDMVLLLATNYESITDGNGKVNSWVHRELAFVVPVVWRRKEDRKVLDVGFVHAFFFADSDIETILLRERVGFPVVRATLDSPETIWIKEFQPHARSAPLLTLRTEVVGAFYPGQKVEPQQLLEIEVSSQAEVVSLIPPGSQRTLRRSASPKKLNEAVERIQKLIQFSGALPVNRFTLKQYPDAANAGDACYQSLISAPEILRNFTVKPFGEGFVKVAIDTYPSFPIVEMLGLAVARRELHGKRVREILEPDQAFWVQSDTTFDLEHGYCWRGRDGKWVGWEEPEAQAPSPFDPDGITPGLAIARLLDVLREPAKSAPMGGG